MGKITATRGEGGERERQVWRELKEEERKDE